MILVPRRLVVVARGLVVASILLAGAALLVACLGARAAENAVIDGAKLACLLESDETNARVLTDLCKVAPALVEDVVQLVGVREAARAKGVRYHRPARDAGVGGVDGSP